MEFVCGQARLVWEQGRGYQHPRSGQWVATPLEALGGWIAPREQRAQWVRLVQGIDEFWRHAKAQEVGQDQVVEFG